MPSAFSRCAVASELATAPSNLCLILPSSAMKKFAVEPRAHADDAAGGHVRDRRARDRLLELVLGHRCVMRD